MRQLHNKFVHLTFWGGFATLFRNSTNQNTNNKGIMLEKYMKIPPAEIDGARVLEWAWSGDKPFGVIPWFGSIL